MHIQNKKRFVRFSISLLVLFLVCIVPHFSDLYLFNRNTVQVESVDVKYASVKDTVIQQTIYLQGYIDNLEIFFYAPSGQLYEDATVTIAITQGFQHISETANAKQLLVHNEYERLLQQEIPKSSPITEKKTMYRMQSNLLRLSEGEAILSITSSNLPKGTDLFCGVSETVISGLPNAKADMHDLGSPLVLSYDVLKINGQFWYETILLTLLFIAIGITSFLLVDERKLIDRKGVLFLCAFAIIFLFVCIQNPFASLQGEPRSEAAYEFWYKAQTMGFWGSLMSLMSGESLVWTERILMWVSNTFSPTKYVFVVAQTLELLFISFVTAMPCSTHFKKFLSNETRLLFSIFCGTSLLFYKAYFFWSVSYWALFFLIFFACLDMNRLKHTTFITAILLTIILCVSRIYHVVFIPIALALFFLLGSKKGKRFKIYCMTVAGASTFEVVYSLWAGRHLMENAGFIQNVLDLGMGRIIQNTLYYQVQVLNSFFTGTKHNAGSISNAFFLIIFLMIVCLFFYLLFSKKHFNKELMCILGSCGIISLGTIAVSVVTSGSYEMIMFPINYASPVDWNQNYYQQADLHFSYAYIVLMFLIITFIIVFKQQLIKYCNNYVVDEEKEKACFLLERCGQIMIAVLIITLCSNMAHRREGYIYMPTQWKNVSYVTEQDTYFLPINTFYGATQISLEHNSNEYVYGLDEKDHLYLWEFGSTEYKFDKPYSSASIGKVSDIETKKILTCTVRRALTNFDCTYIAVFENRAGEELARVPQADNPERIWLTFIPNQPLKDVATIRFELSDGQTAYINDAMQVGYILEEY